MSTTASSTSGGRPAPRPRKPTVQYRADWTDRIPAELRAQAQWVAWRFVFRDGRWTKIPHCPIPDAKGRYREGKSNTPETWGTHDQARLAFADRAGRFDGIGFVFAADDPYCGIDFDNCYLDDGTLAPWAAPYLDRLASYCEVSPSGRGLKVFARATLPDGKGRKKTRLGDDETGAIEIYDRRRFFTVTGNPPKSTPPDIRDCGAAIRELHAELFPPALPKNHNPQPIQPLDLSDQDILNRAFASKNGATIAGLYAGDILGYGSHSEADAALCVRLMFWFAGDTDRIDRVFRQSGLYRDKWNSVRSDDGRTYGRLTLDYAREKWDGECYDPRPKAKVKKSERIERAIQDATASPAGSKGRSFACTDLGNAERLVARHGGDLRYCHPWRKWLVWDGRRWRVDNTGGVRRRARETVRWILVEAADIPQKSLREEMVKHQIASEHRSRIGSMVHLAEAEAGIPILPADMDRDPWLFNCLNGTVDLRTGVLRPHRREELLTTLCPIRFDPAATCPLWESTLNLFLGGNAALIDYWQRLCGYTMVGVVRDHILPVAYGTGSNGKSTILGTLLDLFGPDYAMKADSGLLMARATDSHPTERADLFGKRLVVAIETQENRRLNESLVKELTGGDRIRARRMREDFWEFAPSHTVMMATNHKPAIGGTDHGIWRRLKLVPFAVKVEDQSADKAMPEKLRAEYPGILAWCVRGCLGWQARGLDAPPEVTEATAEYRGEQDTLGSFLAEHAVLHATVRAKASALYARYRVWAQAGGEHTLSQTAFGLAMNERGFEKIRSNGYWYLGVGLRDSAESQQPQEVNGFPQRIDFN